MSNGTKYWGSINLDEIKNAIKGGAKLFEGKKGKYLDVNVWVNDEPDQYGNSCSIQVWNKDTKQATYLGNLKKSEFEGVSEPKKQDEPDLPF